MYRAVVEEGGKRCWRGKPVMGRGCGGAEGDGGWRLVREVCRRIVEFRG